ncbi:MAG TPA: hypothetical protein VHZ03_56795 [Trebonia sp.]|jgi:hypothetical protein|nr:hypothetical protein [Trebonia sp.]
MATWVLLLIAIAAAVVIFAYRARKKDPIEDPESMESMTEGSEQIDNAGTDGPDRASSILRPLADTQIGQSDPARYSVVDNDGTDSPDRASSILRPLPGTQTGQSDLARHAALASDTGAGGQPYAQLLETHELQSILGQWKDIQAAFVDEPRKAIQDADALVAELMQRLAETFANEREQLESQWAGGADVSTEDLRRGLRRYRSFFERLLAAGPGSRSRAGTG